MFDRLYGTIALGKRQWVERHPDARRRLARPVVSVGNLSVGGTGKTPVVAAIAAWLIARGERPSILSRGYKRQRQVDGVVVVSDGTRVLAGVDEAGDEPLMLARQLPGAAVCVGADRHLSGVLAERRLGCTVHLLDDGFQHVRLARDLDVLVTSVGEIPTGRVLPAGRLREPMAAASRAHLAIVSDADIDAARGEAWTLGISQFAAMTRRLGPPRWLDGGPPPTDHGAPRPTDHGGPRPIDHGGPRFSVAEIGDPSDSARVGHHFSGAGIVAMAGIAHPDRFFAALRTAGYTLARTLPFADHHVYTPRDLRAIEAAVRETGAAAVLTTEKDAVKLEALAPLPWPVAALPLLIDIEPWTTVTAALETTLDRVRGAA